tara:strand:- start:286 stop:2109 length:1824 start_codon:yes stop_codon:yes gene_type:complete
MSYTVNKSDGTVLTIVGDGTVDATSTDLTLVGRKYSGYGEVLNENFVKILESFANRTAPTNPIEGQIWYDTLEGRLKVYTGSAFKPTGGPLVQNTEPAGLVIGDLWINNEANQLYFYDGVNLSLAGPIYSTAQGKHGWVVENIIDQGNNGRSISSLYVNDLRIGILSRYQFTPQTPISGFATVNVGLNLSTTVNGLKLHGTASSADQVAGITPGQFLRSDESDITTGTLGILNDGGITVGADSNFTIVVDTNDKTTLKTNLQDRDFSFQVNSSATGGLTGLFDVDSSALTLKIYDGLTNSTTTVGGNMNISGDLTVGGNTSFIDTTTLRVADKNIELAFGDTPTDVLADGGGLNLRGNTDHTITWARSTQEWTSSDAFGVASAKYFHVDGNNVLSQTALGATVKNSSLENVGTLTELQVDDIHINDGVISTNVSNVDITLNPNGTGSIKASSSQIKDVADPTQAQDVTTKTYVDNAILQNTIVLTMNVTGMTQQNTNDIPNQLAKLAPPASFPVGTQARILCESLSLAGAPTNITVNTSGVSSGLTNELLANQVAVDKDNNLSSQSVIQSLSFPNGITPSGNSIAVTRVTKLFQIDGTPTWVYVQDI